MIYFFLILLCFVIFFGIREIIKDNKLTRNQKTLWLLFVLLFNVLTIFAYLLVKNFKILRHNKWFFSLILFFLSCNTLDQKREAVAALEVVPQKIDFGIIKEDSILKGKFCIKNIGKSDVKILNIISSCGCTVIKSDLKIIQIDDSSFVDFEFDSKGKLGLQDRYISIFANTKDTLHFFEIKGEVIK